MKERKVIELLQHFSKRNLKNLKRFVESQYFNTNTAISDLYNFIYRFAPDFTHQDLTIENAFKKVYPNKKFEERIITRLISKLFKLIEQFIIQTKLESNELQQKFLLLDFYSKKQLPKFFDSTYSLVCKVHDEYPYRDDDYYYNQYIIEYHSAKHLSKLDDRSRNINISNTVYAFDTFYWIRKIMLLCLQLNRNNIVANSDYDLSEVNFVIDKLRNHKLLKVPTLNLWYRALVLLNEPGEIENYQNLKMSLSMHDHLLGSEEIQNLYTFIINSVVILFPPEEIRYMEYFSLFNEQIVKGHVYTDGYLFPQILKNIITVAIKLKKYDWAEEFLAENKDKIVPKEVYYWNLTKIYYAKKDYDKALGILENNKYNDVFYVLSTKRLLLKIYYELNYIDLLYSYINSFRVFLSRKDIVEYEKKRQQNFVNFFQQLLKLIPRDIEKKNAFLAKLAKNDNVAEKEWLLEKVNKFK